MATQLRNSIAVASRRQTVQVTFPNDITLEGDTGTTIEEFLKAAEPHLPGRYDRPTMGGILDHRPRELAYPVTRDCNLQPLLLSSSDGGRIYRRSLVMLLATAAGEVWPDLQVEVSYSIPEGGFYCTVVGRPPLSDNELAQLEA